MEIFDLLLSILGGLVAKVFNRAFGTDVKLGYGGEIVTGLFTLILLIVILFLFVRGFVALGSVS